MMTEVPRWLDHYHALTNMSAETCNLSNEELRCDPSKLYMGLRFFQ